MSNDCLVLDCSRATIKGSYYCKLHAILADKQAAMLREQARKQARLAAVVQRSRIEQEVYDVDFSE